MLEAHGFRRFVVPLQRATFRFGYKAWTYLGRPPQIPIDLHRGLAEPPWFDLAADAFIDRAMAYDSVDGPLLSLSPEDQVVYAAVHYAKHRFTIDQRHLQDVVLLLAARAVDWEVVVARGRAAGITVPLALLLEALRARGAAVPHLATGWTARWRLRYARRWVAIHPELRRRAAGSRIVDNAVRMPMLSDQPTALPRYLVRHAVLRVLDGCAAATAMVCVKIRPGPLKDRSRAMRST
jgi:hypothetical protein